MHGRPREYKHKLRDPAAQEGYKKKVDAIRNGTAMILECRRQQKYEQPVLDASAKLLRVVPEIYTIWNFRREALSPILAAGGEAAVKAAEGELALTQACLTENPKSYSTWHHRKWVVAHGLGSLVRELALVSKALDADERNFHAWGYRQYIVKLLGTPVEEELCYSEEKVAQNFSNYSAWHYRTILLPKLHCGDAQADGAPAPAEPSTSGSASVSSASASASATAAATPTAAAASGGGLTGCFGGSASQRRALPAEVLDQEYDMCHQAFATDSRDQSPWMYYRWLVGNSLARLEAARGGPAEEAERSLLQAVLEREVSRLREDHLAADPEAKWPLLTVARLREAQSRLGLLAAGPEHERAVEEVKSIYERLIELDPMRRGYYRDALEGRAFVVVQALGTV